MDTGLSDQEDATAAEMQRTTCGSSNSAELQERPTRLRNMIQYVHDILRGNVVDSEDLTDRSQQTEEELESSYQAPISSLKDEICDLRQRNAQLSQKVDEKGSSALNLEDLEQVITNKIQSCMDHVRAETCKTIDAKFDEMRKEMMEFAKISSTRPGPAAQTKMSQAQEEIVEESIPEGVRNPLVPSHMNPVVLLERYVPTEDQLRRAKINGPGLNPSQEEVEMQSNQVQAKVVCTLTKRLNSFATTEGTIMTRSMSRK